MGVFTNPFPSCCGVNVLCNLWEIHTDPVGTYTAENLRKQYSVGGLVATVSSLDESKAVEVLLRDGWVELFRVRSNHGSYSIRTFGLVLRQPPDPLEPLSQPLQIAKPKLSSKIPPETVKIAQWENAGSSYRLVWWKAPGQGYTHKRSKAHNWPRDQAPLNPKLFHIKPGQRTPKSPK